MAASPAVAQTLTRVYTLENVWLLPDISHPGSPPQQMTGSFEWTYQQGDFENGSGQFTEMYIPWWGSDISELVFTIDLTSIEITLGTSYHDLGVDITLHLLEPLSMDQPATIDTVRSQFQIEVGVIHKGHVTNGSVVPCAADFNYDGAVNSLDFIAFLNAFTAGDPSADFNGDGAINSLDFIAFLNAFTAGC
jgi:hypothetical protein